MKYILALLLVACTTTPWKEAKPTTFNTINSSDIVKKVFVTLTGLDVVPRVRMIYGKTSCLSGPNPIWIPVTSSLPREGAPFRLGWAIETVATPPPPSADVSILVAFRSRSEALDLTPNGMPGCMLLVEPDYILRPTKNVVDPFYYNPSTGLGYIQFVPANGLRGTKLYMQLVVTNADGTTRLSAAVELTIGS